MSEKEMVNHPEHYHPGQYECINVMEAVYGQQATSDFCLLNAFKYLYRCREKGKPVEDLQKADWYIKKAIELQKGEQDE